MLPGDELANDGRPSSTGERKTSGSSRNGRYVLPKTMMLLQEKGRSTTLSCNCFLDERHPQSSTLQAPLISLYSMHLQL